MGLREATATHQMLIGFQDAIETNTWTGKHLQAVAMGLEMIRQMRFQYQVQVETLKKQQKQMEKSAKEAIKQAGGQITSEAPNAGNAETPNPAA